MTLHISPVDHSIKDYIIEKSFFLNSVDGEIAYGIHIEIIILGLYKKGFRLCGFRSYELEQPDQRGTEIMKRIVDKLKYLENLYLYLASGSELHSLIEPYHRMNNPHRIKRYFVREVVRVSDERKAVLGNVHPASIRKCKIRLVNPHPFVENGVKELI